MEQVARLEALARCNPTGLAVRRQSQGIGHHVAKCRPARNRSSLLVQQRTCSAIYPPHLRGLLQPTRPVLHAVQQQQAQETQVSLSDADSADEYLIDQAQLRKLAQSRDTQLFDGTNVANVGQLANALRTSLEFGLVTDPEDLQRRAAYFGSNTLPVKQEVN